MTKLSDLDPATQDKVKALNAEMLGVIESGMINIAGRDDEASIILDENMANDTAVVICGPLVYQIIVALREEARALTSACLAAKAIGKARAA